MPRAPPPPPDEGAPGTAVKAKRKVKVSDSEGTLRTLSAYNLFVREMLRQYKLLDTPQVIHLYVCKCVCRQLCVCDMPQVRHVCV